MEKRIAIDIGNTRKKIGLFSGDCLMLIDTKETEEWDQEYLDRWCNTYRPDQLAISSTVHLPEQAQKWIHDRKVIEIGPNLNFPFDIKYRTPETLGQDRLAAVSAAYALYKGENVLVIDAGTCITYDFLTQSGIYLGGNISPGIQMRLAAMHYYTQKLPRVFMTGEELKWIGQSTNEALRAGGAAMSIMEARGFMMYLVEEFGGELAVVLTGGDHHYFMKHLGGRKFVEPNLVLLGLNEIMKNNEV